MTTTMLVIVIMAQLRTVDDAAVAAPPVPKVFASVATAAASDFATL